MKYAALLALIIVAFLMIHPANTSDWPQYRGPNRTGVSNEEKLQSDWAQQGPKLLWTYRSTGVGYSGPSVVGDVLYISGGRENQEYLMALDLKAIPPKEIWSVKIGPLFTWKGNSWNEGPNVSPTVEGDSVFALGGFGDLICVNLRTGTERWRVNLPKDFGGEVNPIGGGLEEPTPLGWGYASAPLVDGNQLIVVPGGKNGLLAALDKYTGKLLWQSKEVIDQASYSSPVLCMIDGSKQCVQVVNSGIVGIDARNGKRLWQYHRPAAYDDVVIATPLILDHYILATVGFGQGCDLIKVTSANGTFSAEKVISDKTLQNRDGGVILLGKYLYGYSEGRGWVCKDFITGKEEWTEKRKLGRGSISSSNDRLYCLSEEGTVVLAAASPEAWKEHGRFALPESSAKRKPSGGVWTHPVISNGRLYLRDQELLFCYDLRP
ncbi:MAG: PQQ-like beta-propeller repeat protein [Gemmatales bacterium]